MIKVMKTLLFTTSVLSTLGSSVLMASNEAIDRKANAIIVEAQGKADKLVEDAKIRARALVEQAKVDAAALKRESKQNLAETTNESKKLGMEALEKANQQKNTFVEDTKQKAENLKSDLEDTYLYHKEIINDSIETNKIMVNDTLIHSAIRYAFLNSPEIHSMNIKIDVNNGEVELFGKVNNAVEAQSAIRIALSTKGVHSVKTLFVIQP